MPADGACLPASAQENGGAAGMRRFRSRRPAQTSSIDLTPIKDSDEPFKH